ncbi:hypothetical protein EV383_1291 [Pseudonocardia sediminis]|uniref:Uncharacterized protein n=1 Tax=Pseudonocardia sediminis TaxID=1397368 RepID=A0A4V2FQE9_PSEST|nr:hypothetical protein [Pseudonocardia sediminis]RZT84450.1 hypothetical protein EV383_1291 [Pseudonocardia sediminis]
MPEIANPQLRGAVDHLITQVTPENVLDVRRVLLQEVVDLQTTIDRYDKQGDYRPTGPAATGGMGTPGVGFHVGHCSGDPISGPAAISFNRKIDGIVDGCKAYVADLNTAAESLAAIARNYDIAEDAIQTSFASVSLTW